MKKMKKKKIKNWLLLLLAECSKSKTASMNDWLLLHNIRLCLGSPIFLDVWDSGAV
jgi:hypothetical protein